MTDHRVTADWTSLMYQASSTASAWFGEAMKALHDYPGEGDQTKIAAELAKVAAIDMLATSLSVAADKISDSLSEIAVALSKKDAF